MKKSVNNQHFSPGKSNITRHISLAELKDLYDEIEEEYGIMVGQWPVVKFWDVRFLQVFIILIVMTLFAVCFFCDRF